MSDDGRELVAAMHCEALRLQKEQEAQQRALVHSDHHDASEPIRRNPPSAAERPKGVHFTELPEAKPGDVFYLEWNTYRNEVGRLLTEGHEGRFVLIKGTEIIGIYLSWDAARVAGLKRYQLQSFLVHPIRVEEPYLRIRGINLPWRSSLSQ